MGRRVGAGHHGDGGVDGRVGDARDEDRLVGAAVTRRRPFRAVPRRRHRVGRRHRRVGGDRHRGGRGRRRGWLQHRRLVDHERRDDRGTDHEEHRAAERPPRARVARRSRTGRRRRRHGHGRVGRHDGLGHTRSHQKASSSSTSASGSRPRPALTPIARGFDIATARLAHARAAPAPDHEEPDHERAAEERPALPLVGVLERRRCPPS